MQETERVLPSIVYMKRLVSDGIFEHTFHI